MRRILQRKKINGRLSRRKRIDVIFKMVKDRRTNSIDFGNKGLKNLSDERAKLNQETKKA